MTIKTMFSGAVVATSWTLDWTDGGGGPFTVAIPDGTYYVLGDGTANDLLQAMKVGADAVAASTLSYDISDAGCVGFAVASGTATIDATPGGGSTALGAALGFTVTTLPLTTAFAYAATQPPSLAVSTLPTRVDLPTPKGRQSTSEADDYHQRTLTLSAVVKEHRLSIRYDGPPRSTTRNGYDMFEAFWRTIIRTGTLARYYPDRSQSTTAWVQTSNPYGYHVGRFTRPKNEWTPRTVVANWYQWFVADLGFLEQTS